MKSADKHPLEALRINLLRDFEILDTDAEVVFDELTEIASNLCDTPIALVSLIDERRQWFKSHHGLDAEETSREFAFCAHAILQDDLFVVEDADQDERFYDNPLVTGPPHVKFYAGAVLKSKDDLPLGTLCVIDHKPRTLTAKQQRSLEIIARQVESQLEIRLANLNLKKLNQTKKNIMTLVAHDLKGSFASVLGFSKIMAKKLDSFEEAIELRKMGHHLIASANDVFKLLDELLQWTEIQMGNSKIQPHKFHLVKDLKECVDLFIDVAQAKEITIKMSIPSEVEVYADPSITKTVLRNFLSNAIKYSPRSSVIEVGVDQVENQKFVVLWVRDYGAGMPPAIKRALFSYMRKSRPGTEDELGHGIGLSLCKSIARQQESDLWVDDQVTKGCKMCLSIPLMTQSGVCGASVL